MGGAYRAAIVDLDGTMVDTLGDFEVALNRTLADLDLPGVTRALVERTVGKGSEHLIRSVLTHQLTRVEACAGRSVDTLYEPAWQRYQHHYHQINGAHSAVYPGVAEGLQALRDMGWALACLTNKPLAFARDLLAAKGLAGHFSQVGALAAQEVAHIGAALGFAVTETVDPFGHISPRSWRNRPPNPWWRVSG